MIPKQFQEVFNLNKIKSWKPKRKETQIQKIYREVRRQRFIRQLIEIIILLALIVYMLIDLYRDGRLDFLLK
jgi:hypothetical protein